MAAVRDRGEDHLGDESGQEPDADDQAEPVSLDAVLVAEVVEHREHDAVPGCQERGHEPELQHPPSRHGGDATGEQPDPSDQTSDPCVPLVSDPAHRE